jgi:hypothetical protein
LHAGKNLLFSASQLARRCRDTPMDADAEKDLEYYFIMTFHGRTQSDAVYNFTDDD